MKYTGSCHCGSVKFEVEISDLKEWMTCNCSICKKKATLLTFAPEGTFHLLQGQEDLKEYTFNKNVISHLFCKHCGTQSFSRGKWEMAWTVAVNIHCLDWVDESTLKITEYNGKDI